MMHEMLIRKHSDGIVYERDLMTKRQRRTNGVLKTMSGKRPTQRASQNAREQYGFVSSTLLVAEELPRK